MTVPLCILCAKLFFDEVAPIMQCSSSFTSIVSFGVSGEVPIEGGLRFLMCVTASRSLLCSTCQHQL